MELNTELISGVQTSRRSSKGHVLAMTVASRKTARACCPSILLDFFFRPFREAAPTGGSRRDRAGRYNSVRKIIGFCQKHILNISFGRSDPFPTFVDSYMWIQREG